MNLLGYDDPNNAGILGMGSMVDELSGVGSMVDELSGLGDMLPMPFDNDQARAIKELEATLEYIQGIGNIYKDRKDYPPDFATRADKAMGVVQRWTKYYESALRKTSSGKKLLTALDKLIAPMSTQKKTVKSVTLALTRAIVMLRNEIVRKHPIVPPSGTFGLGKTDPNEIARAISDSIKSFSNAFKKGGDSDEKISIEKVALILGGGYLLYKILGNNLVE